MAKNQPGRAPSRGIWGLWARPGVTALAMKPATSKVLRPQNPRCTAKGHWLRVCLQDERVPSMLAPGLAQLGSLMLTNKGTNQHGDKGQL